MKNHARKVIASTIALFGLLSGSVAFASPANAATCYATSCYQKDPQVTGCSDTARTIGWIDNGVEIRFSQGCSTFWLRNVTAYNRQAKTLTKLTNSVQIWDIPGGSWYGGAPWSVMAPMSPTDLVSIKIGYAGNGTWTQWYNTNAV